MHHSFEKSESQNFIARFKRTLHTNPTLISLIILAISISVFGFLVDFYDSSKPFFIDFEKKGRFLASFNLSLVLQQVTIIGIIGAAQTLIILTAGIDLSVGAIMVLCSVIMGRLGVILGLNEYLALLVGLIAGTGCGVINGIFVTRLKMPPFIVTLGTWSIFFSLNLWYSGSNTIRSQDVSDIAPLLKFLGTSLDFAGARLTYGSIMMVLIIIALWVMLNKTAFGRHIHAVGDDPEAARLAGIKTDKVLLMTYALAGFICALGAWALIGRIGSVSPQAGQTANLDSITAVVIGGTSLFGGRGAIQGTLFGALIVGIFRNGLALYGVDVLWQEFAIGALIISAVALDQWIRRGTV